MKVLIFATILSVMLNGTSIYDFRVASLSGGTIDFSEFRGQKILVVNTASACGYTPQYAGLEKLWQDYRGKLVIVGFPSNDFGEQEPGSNEEILDFCSRNYGVTFPMAAKTTVKGEHAAPLYRFLVQEAKALGIEDPLRWNFTKFLVNEEGRLVTVFSHKISPDSEEILRYLN